MTGADTPSSLREILTVSQLNFSVHSVLEDTFPLLWVEGELTNFSAPSSGHWYFTLKDTQAQVRCAMFKGRNRYTGFKPKNGEHLLVSARVSLYEPRGDYQLIVESMEPAGSGALQRAFEELKNRLQQEGLFATEHKKALPPLPKTLGVVTSPSGAALRDILHVLQRRFPALPVIVYPTSVQGKNAAVEICAALAAAQRHGVCDVLLLARGGGSLEDLWPFNEESVARALYQCSIPVITGIGHETDITIADFVADVRAPTPSAAAELATPDQQQWLQALAQKLDRLQRLMLSSLRVRQSQVNTTAKALVHPRKRLLQQAQRLDELEQRAQQAWRYLQQRRLTQLLATHKQLLARTPLTRVQYASKDLAGLLRRLRLAQAHALDQHRQRVATAGQNLQAVSPLATLQRGYAIVRRAEDKQVVRGADDIAVGAQCETRLAHGYLLCTVLEKHNA